MKLSKKILAIVLAAIMIFSVMPLSAFATEWNTEYLEITELQQGDSITSDVEYIEGFDSYKVTLLANGYHFSDRDVAEGYDTVGEEMFFNFGEINRRILPYGKNGSSDTWYVIAVDHNAQTIILSGDADATPATTYTATWKNYNGTVLRTDTNLEEGTTPTYFGKMPAKPSTDTHFYAFSGWTPAVAPIAEDAIYTATFTEMAKSSTVDGCETFVTKSSSSERTFSGDHFSVTNTVIALDSGCSANANSKTTVSSLNGEKITKLVLTRASGNNTAPVVYVNGTAVSGTQSGDVFTFDNLNATSVQIGTDSSSWTKTAELVAYYKEAGTDEPSEANNGASLTIGQDITSNYYVDYQAYEGAYEIEYTYNTISENERQEFEIKSVYLDNIPASMLEGGRVKITVSQAPAQMGELTEIKILNEASDVLDTLHYSSKTYCDNIIAMDDDVLAEYAGTAEKAAQLKTLCHTVVAYGEAAQAVFADYETTPVACASNAVKNQIDAAYCYAEHSVNNNGTVKFKSVSFACTKDARLRLFLDTAAATGKPAAPVEKNGYSTAIKYVVNEGVKVYYIEVSGINAVDFDKKMEVSYGGSSISCSVLDFCGLAFTYGDTPVQNLARTLIVYNQNAEAYFG